jgi:hypothetical protein
MIRIEFWTKNCALLKTIEIESQYVPKAGELIDGGLLLELPEDEVQNFFVTKVIYVIDKKKIMPVVTCRQWLQGSRQWELESRGWLPNTTGNVIHDDEYPCL